MIQWQQCFQATTLRQTEQIRCGDLPNDSGLQRVPGGTSRHHDLAPSAMDFKCDRHGSEVTAAKTAAGDGGEDEDLGDFCGKVPALSRTQPGSKYLQRQLQRGSSRVVGQILFEIEKDVCKLMCDAYGNYLCSAAFEMTQGEQRHRMLLKLAPRMLEIACDRRGTHALQSLIRILKSSEEQDVVMEAVHACIFEMAMNCNGTHVVQSLVVQFHVGCRRKIYKAIEQRFMEVAQHAYGLCVVKKCITQAREDGYEEEFLDKLTMHAFELVQSPYGNYTVQHALKEWGGDFAAPIIRRLEGKIVQLSIQKFSSNVVETMLELALPEVRQACIHELTDRTQAPVLVNSNYAHFVIKKALQVADPAQASALVGVMRVAIAPLANKRLKSRWEKVLGTSVQVTNEQ